MNEKGKIISMWSKAGHQNGITVNTVSLILRLSEMFPKKNILTIDTNFRFAFLEHYLNSQSSKNLDTLLNQYLTDRLTTKSFCDSLSEIKNIKNKNVYCLNASRNVVYNHVQELIQGLEKILNIAMDYMDFIVIDNSAGITDTSILINKKADVVVNFLKQNKVQLEYMKKHNQFNDLKDSKKYINIINMYHPSKGITLKDIIKLYGINNLEYIPIYEEIDYLINDSSLIDVLLDKETEYYQQINSITYKILNMLNIETKEEADKVKSKRGILNLLFNKT